MIQNLFRTRFLAKFCYPKFSPIYAKICYSTAQSNPPENYKFSKLCSVFEIISSNKSRNHAIKILTETLQKCSNSENSLKSALKLCSCTIRPSHVGVRQNMLIADKILSEVLKDLFEIDEYEFIKESKEIGDLSVYAQKLSEKNPGMINKNPGAELSCEEIVNELDKLYEIKGKDSQLKKKEELRKILSRAKDGVELKYLIRIIQGKLRIGVSTKTVMAALEKLESSKIKTGDQSKNIMISMAEQEVLGKQVSSEGKNLQLGIPIPHMLGRPALSIPDARKLLMKSFGSKIICETKYDGERTHLHYSPEKGLIMYSRNGERQNEKYPSLFAELFTYFRQSIGQNSVILDGEIIGINDIGKICDFQEVGKKDSCTKKLLKVIVFDILWHNGEITQIPILQRKEILNKTIPQDTNILEKIQFELVDFNNEKAEEKIMELYNDAKNKNCEGLMIKTANEKLSFYDTSGSRRQWIKVFFQNLFKFFS